VAFRAAVGRIFRPLFSEFTEGAVVRLTMRGRNKKLLFVFVIS
jgi:hypothetical protein